MKTCTFAVVVATGFAALAQASGHHARHLEFHARKDVTAIEVEPSADSSCGCYTYTTTIYSEWGLVPEETTSSSVASSTSTWVEPTSTYTPPPASETSSSTSSSIWVAPTTYAAPTSSYVAPSSNAISSSAAPSSYVAPSSRVTSSGAAPSSSSGSSGTIAPNDGDKWAFCYTPYANDGTCKSASQVSSDIAAIKSKGFTTIRLYATDCSGPQNVGSAAAANGMKLIIGIYIDGSGIGSNTDEQIVTLTQWGQGKWDLVEMIVAGNEAIFNGFASASQLAGFVADVKSKFKAAGYSGPVGTTEPLGTFQDNAATLCPAVDYAGANIHPFFNTDVTAESAGTFVAKQLEDLAAACGNKMEAYNLESGWPSSGLPNGFAVPGSWDQKTAIEGIIAAAGSKSSIFSFENDAWKAPGPFNVEQFWGCADLFDA